MRTPFFLHALALTLALASCAPTLSSPPVAVSSRTLPVYAARGSQPGPQVVVTEYDLPTPNALPGGLVVGGDGAIWFHETGANRIGRITTGGQVTEYPIPTAESTEPRQGFVGVAPDGAVWFTQSAADRLGRIGMDGRVSEVRVPTYNSSPLGVAAGPDGAMWFPQWASGKVGRVAPDGTVSEIALPEHLARPVGPAVATDGALWFRVRDLKAAAWTLLRMTTDGKYTLFPVGLGPEDKPIVPLRMTAAGDGAMWFAGSNASVIGRVTADGQISFFPAPGMNPVSVVVGPDGAVWFTGYNSHEIGRMTADGRLTRYPVLTPQGRPYHIVLGPDRALWFTLMDAGKIGRLEVR